jgi:hypothetical protein
MCRKLKNCLQTFWPEIQHLLHTRDILCLRKVRCESVSLVQLLRDTSGERGSKNTVVNLRLHHESVDYLDKCQILKENHGLYCLAFYASVI